MNTEKTSFSIAIENLRKGIMSGIADTVSTALSGGNPVGEAGKTIEGVGDSIKHMKKDVPSETYKHPDKLGEGAKKRKKLKNPDDKFEAVMHEFKTGTLHSGSGEIVRDRAQALAIAGSESGKYMEEDEEIEDNEKEKPMKKAFIKIYNGLFLKIDSDLEKAKKSQIGETATWADGKTYRKVSEHKWELVEDKGVHKHSDGPGSGGDKKDASTPSKLHEIFRIHIEKMSDEHRAVFRGGKMDFDKRMFIAPGGKVALQYKGGNIHVIKMGDMAKAGPGFAHKYIKRVPKPTGKGYIYFYTRKQGEKGEGKQEKKKEDGGDAVDRITSHKGWQDEHAESTARLLDDKENAESFRSAIKEYSNYLKKNPDASNSEKIKSAHSIIEDYFQDVSVRDQDYLSVWLGNSTDSTTSKIESKEKGIVSEKLEINKNHVDSLSPKERGKLNSALDRKYKFSSGIKTLKEFMEGGDIVSVKSEDTPGATFDRTKYNRMNGEEQKEYEEKAKEKKKAYYAVKKDGGMINIPKMVHDAYSAGKEKESDKSAVMSGEKEKSPDNFDSMGDYIETKTNEINKDLKAANEDQESIKKKNPDWKKDEKAYIQIKRLDNKIEELTDKRNALNRGKAKEEYRKIAEKKDKLSVPDMRDFPDLAAEQISKESGINFHHDEEMGKNIRARYHDQQIEIDNIGSNGYRINVNGNMVRDDRTSDTRMFKSPKEIKEYLDSRKEKKDKEEREKSDALASQGWEPSKLDKTTLRRNIQTPSNPKMEAVDPKDIKSTFKVWGEDIFIHKSGNGYSATEKKTGLRIGIGSNPKKSIENAKETLSRQGKENFKKAIESNKVKEDENGSIRNPETLSNDQVHQHVLNAAKLSIKELEKNSGLVEQQIKMAEKQGKKDAIRRLEFMGSVYRVAQLHKDRKMDKEEIVNLVDTGADLTRKPLQKASQLSTGTKVESEHKETVDFITKYVKDHGKMPKGIEIYRHIAQNHISGSGGESGIKDYYTRLLAMEKQAKIKRPQIELDVIDFLSKNPNPPDAKVHAFAEKMKINPHDLEKVFYKLATESAKMESALKKASNDLFYALEKAKAMPVGTVSKGRKKVAEGKWVPEEKGKGKPKEEEPDKKPEKKDDKKGKTGGISEEKRDVIKNALKKMANILAEVLSGKGGVQTAGEAVEQGGENIQERAKRALKPTDKEKK